MHQILYAFVFYIRVCERYFPATMTMLFQFLVCKHAAYRGMYLIEGTIGNVQF